MTPRTGTLFLLPTPLADGTALDVLPPATLTVARRVSYFLAEDAKSARAFLRAAGHPCPLQELRIVEIGHQPDPAAVDGWLQPVVDGLDAAIVAEAGCPGVADPGALVVARAHERRLRVQPLVGPSSLLLALMASGLNGQAFRFWGYLPQDAAALAVRLAELERDARRGETQLWIETPYRNERMLDAVLAHCAADSRLTLATDLTSAAESVRTRSIADWRAIVASARPTLHKHPTVFALLAASDVKRPRR
ncbi:MAG: SAM-dependent methyltransferase [Burkholderiaceae bacterium]|jgi:16S rRNA (cytidine1402-2'-O)-methyltransferase|nr:SAM-dependent methyltransferase [Burkholderiaceae bacterium]